MIVHDDRAQSNLVRAQSNLFHRCLYARQRRRWRGYWLDYFDREEPAMPSDQPPPRLKGYSGTRDQDEQDENKDNNITIVKNNEYIRK